MSMPQTSFSPKEDKVGTMLSMFPKLASWLLAYVAQVVQDVQDVQDV